MTRYGLWIDGVGGYLVCTGDEVTLGQPVPGSQVDVPILGDLSRHHANLRRDGEHYWLEALRETRVDGRLVESRILLEREHVVELGARVRLRFTRPHPWSATARLDFLSGHGTLPSCDGVLLAAEACLLGPDPRSHVVCPDWTETLLLVRRGAGWSGQLRAAGGLAVDGRDHAPPQTLEPGTILRGTSCSLRWERWPERT